MGKHKGIDGYIKSIEYTLGQLKEKHEEIISDVRDTAAVESYNEGLRAAQKDAELKAKAAYDAVKATAADAAYRRGLEEGREKGWKAHQAWEDHVETLHGKPDCDTCVYSVFDWDGEHCDECTKGHRQDKMKKMSVEYKHGIVVPKEAFCVCLDAEQLAEIEDEFGSAVVRKIREMGT